MIIKKNHFRWLRNISVLTLVFITSLQIFAQKTATAQLREIYNGATIVNTLEIVSPFKIPQNCLDSTTNSLVRCDSDLIKFYEVNASVYDDSNAGILFEDIEGDAAGNRKVAINNINVSENCLATDFPSKKGTLCLKKSDNGTLKIIYRFVDAPTFEEDKYKIQVVIKEKATNSVKSGYYASAKLEFPIVTPDVAAISDTERKDNKNLKEMIIAPHTTKDIVADNNIIRVSITLPSRGHPFDDAETKLKNARIVISRVRGILKWLDAQEINPSAIADVQIDSRDGTPIKPFALQAFAYLEQDKGITPLTNLTCPNGVTEIPVEIQPLTGREKAIYCDSRLSIYLIGNENLPTKTFFFKVDFKQNPPLEIAKTSEVTPVGSGINSLAAPDAKTVGDNKDLGLRSIKSNVDFGFAYTSSVKTVENKRKRDNNSSFDLVFAPILNKPLTAPTRTQLSITPFFIDAKASANKAVSKDTLSLNRILIGSELNLLHLGKFTEGDETYPSGYDQYKYSFRFINASDRDFKRVEAKFNFETMIRLVSLNRPLSQRFKNLNASDLNRKAGSSEIPTGNFGYQIQPTFGFEIGRVYRDKRTAFEIENQEKFLRRFYLGMDMQFDVTRFAKLTLKDTFYVRGEVKNGRYRNYFLGELVTPVGKFGDKASQSIYMSFERGDQPPFVSPSVNAFKVGYRITANFFDNLIIP